MSIVPVTYYQAKCDGCGEVCTDYGDFSAWADDDFGMMGLEEWAEVGPLRDERHYCPDCQKCEVCGASGYVVDDHIVCDDHEDHEFTPRTCGAFQWIGQNLHHCDECGRPIWEHEYDATPGGGKRVIVDRDKLRARWCPGEGCKHCERLESL